MENQIPQRPAHIARPKKDEAAQRLCLSCLKEFKSKHKHNRICSNCMELNKGISSKHYGISAG
jgi:hypothetical protein